MTQKQILEIASKDSEMVRAWFYNKESEKHFSKVFKNGREMDSFTERAIKVGTVLIGFVGIKYL